MAQWIWEQQICKEIFTQKYCLNNEKSAEEVFRLVAQEIASVEKDDASRKKWEETFFGELVSGRLQPAGRILANARPDSKMKNYNNCFRCKYCMSLIYKNCDIKLNNPDLSGLFFIYFCV